MASSQTGVPRHEMLSLVREVQSNQLFNRQLSSICQVNGLKSTGVKADLQRRIITRRRPLATPSCGVSPAPAWSIFVQRANSSLFSSSAVIQEASVDPSRFAQVKQSVANAFAQRNGTAPATTASPIKSRPSSGAPNVHFPLNVTSYGNGSSAMSQGYGQRNNILTAPTLAFKESPFYKIKMVIGEVRICEGRNLLRNEFRQEGM